LVEWLSCPACGQRYGSFISACPVCGQPNLAQRAPARHRKTRVKKIWIISGVVIAAVVAVVLSAGFGPSPSEKLAEYKQYALERINNDRKQFGLNPVLLSNNEAAQKHADEMLQTRKLSHWTTDGMKPYMRYSINNGTGDVTQNAATQFMFSDGDPAMEARIQLCKRGVAYCDEIDVKQSIDKLQHEMVYNDLECCNDGHRHNILDPYHTHVSIGLAFDGVEIFIVQNFENQYIDWGKPASYDSNVVSMSGRTLGEADLVDIEIYYDPLPTNQTYQQNADRNAYDSGDLVGFVISKDLPFSEEAFEDIPVIRATDWSAAEKNFDISFSLEKLTSEHGPGVYTLTLIGLELEKEDSEPYSLSSISIFKQR